MEVLNVNGNEMRLFQAKAFPIYSYYQCRASGISAVDTTFISLSMTRFGPRIEPPKCQAMFYIVQLLVKFGLLFVAPAGPSSNSLPIPAVQT